MPEGGKAVRSVHKRVCARAAFVCLIHSDIIRHRFLARTRATGISRVASPRTRNGTFRHLLSLRRRGRSIKMSVLHLDDSNTNGSRFERFRIST